MRRLAIITAPINAAPHADEPLRCSSATHRQAEKDLARSGLTLEAVASDGIFATDDASAVNPDWAAHPAIIFPYFRRDGTVSTYRTPDGRAVPYARARYLPGPLGNLPRDRKYDQPKGSGVHIYVPRDLDMDRVRRGGVCLVEGEKKALALTLAGAPSIGIGGVNSFLQSNTKALHPDLAAIIGEAKAVFIVFDSDVLTNERVQEAEWKLANHIALMGKPPHCVRLPPGVERDASGKPLKVGADDFLASAGADALVELIRCTPALGERESDQRALHALPVADLLTREVRPVPELVPGWLEQGIPTFLAGPGGVHKSRLAMQFGLALNAGVSPFGEQQGAVSEKLGVTAAQATLVYVSAEDDENELARRAQAISRELRLPAPSGGAFFSRKGRDSALAIMSESGECELRPFYYQLAAQLRATPGHKIIVLDSAYDFVRFAGRAKIDEDSVNLFIKVILQGVCDQTDSTLLIPWHPSQAGSGREQMDGWSVAWRNAPRARLALSATDMDDEIELRVEKRNHAAKGAPIILRFHNGALLPRESLARDTDGGKFRRVAVQLAIRAAEMGMPYTQQRNIPGPVLQQAEKECGRKLTAKAFKDELRTAVEVGELQYLRGDKRQSAGFYPSDDARAKELAKRAKRGNETAHAEAPQ